MPVPHRLHVQDFRLFRLAFFDRFAFLALSVLFLVILAVLGGVLLVVGAAAVGPCNLRICFFRG